MAGIYMRRFFHLEKPDASLSSRFGGMPALMIREPSPPPTVRQSLGNTTGLNPYIILPPIKYKKFGSDSDVNSLAQRWKNSSSSNTNHSVYPSAMSHHSILDHLIQLVGGNSDYESEGSKYLLPESPIALTEEQENAVLLEANYQLTGSAYDISGGLRELYLSLTDIDTDLSGCVAYGDLLLAFQRKRVPITEQLLRIIAAQFVSRKETDKVNYEKILSFIGAATKIHKPQADRENYAESQTSRRLSPERRHNSPSRAIYYHDLRCQNDEDINDVLTEKDDPVLLKLLENSIRHQFTPINLESLRISFQRADRLHRGSLSPQQIKDLCYQHDIRIEESIMDRIIHRCKQRGGGQYDWQQFIKYLERVQPVQTSLNITGNRMPVDYRMYIPHPSSSWPQAESPSHWGTPLPRQQSPALPIYKSEHEINLPPPLAPKSNHEVQTLNLNDNEDEYQNQQQPLQWKLEQLENEVNQLTSRQNERDTNEDMLNQTLSMYPNNTVYVSNRPWFDRFMEMADQFYKNDVNSTGSMTQSLVLQLIEQYNNKLQLHFNGEDIGNALVAGRKSSGNVDINNFLKFLATKSTKKSIDR